MPITFELPVIAPISAIPFLVVCVWALFDVITGLTKAFAANNFYFKVPQKWYIISTLIPKRFMVQCMVQSNS